MRQVPKRSKIRYSFSKSLSPKLSKAPKSRLLINDAEFLKISKSKNILILGKGSLGTALVDYLNSLGLKAQSISMREFLGTLETKEPLVNSLKLRDFRFIGLCGREDQNKRAAEFLVRFKKQNTIQLPLLQFSGSAEIPGTHVWHPLASFAKRRLSKNEFKNLTWVSRVEDPCPDLHLFFGVIRSKVSNKIFRISKFDRSFYHALAVTAVTSTFSLWQTYFSILSCLPGLEPNAGVSLMKSVFYNLLDYQDQYQSLNGALTGPLARRELHGLSSLQTELANRHPLFARVFESALLMLSGKPSKSSLELSLREIQS